MTIRFFVNNIMAEKQLKELCLAQLDQDGVLTDFILTSGADAVKFTEQTLTTVQKAQTKTNLSITDPDQTYNPLSTSAQSGVALQPILDSKQVKLTAGTPNVIIGADGTLSVTASSVSVATETTYGTVKILDAIPSGSETLDPGTTVEADAIKVKFGTVDTQITDLDDRIDAIETVVPQNAGVNLPIASVEYVNTEITSISSDKQNVLTAGSGIDITSDEISVTPATSTTFGGVKIDVDETNMRAIISL